MALPDEARGRSSPALGRLPATPHSRCRRRPGRPGGTGPRASRWLGHPTRPFPYPGTAAGLPRRQATGQFPYCRAVASQHVAAQIAHRRIPAGARPGVNWGRGLPPAKRWAMRPLHAHPGTTQDQARRWPAGGLGGVEGQDSQTPSMRTERSARQSRCSTTFEHVRGI